MHLPRLRTAAPFVAALALTAPAAEPRAADPRPAPVAANLLDAVAPNYRDAVGQVVRQPTLTARATDEEFTAHATVYEWLIEHPDRTALAWQRLKVPCVDITDLGDGRFHWTDDAGSELTWRTVGRLADGRVWYATGKVKPGTLLPAVPVKAVAVLRHPPAAAAKDPAVTYRPTLNVYLLTDSRGASAVLRVVGPAAPRMAEQGAEQLLLFFSGPARHLYEHPDQAAALLAPKGK